MAIPLAVGIWAAFSAIAVPLVVRILIALGIGSVTYVGIKALFDSLLANVQSQFAGFPTEVLDVIAVMRVDDAVTVLFSAIVVRLAFAGLTAAGAIQRVKWTLPTGGA